MVLDQLAEAVGKPVVAELGDGGEHAMIHSGARHRCDPHHPLRVGRHLTDAVLQRVPQAARQYQAGGACGQQLLGEEGIAAGSGEDGGDELRLGRRSANARQLGGDLRLAERRELDDLDTLEPDQLGQQRSEGMPAMELVGSICPHHQDPFGTGVPNEEAEQVPRGGIRPMEILQDEHERLVLGQAVEDAEHDLEEPRPGRRGGQ